jgi:AcrR family transcriptional regulator
VRREVVHPTKQLLIDVVVEMLNTKSPMELSTDEVLAKSYTTKGSLYHHFQDFNELIETALITRFSRYVNGVILSLQTILEGTHSKAEALEQFRAAAKRLPKEDSRAIRIERIHSLSLAYKDPRFFEALRDEQDRLTDGWEALFLQARAKGWAKEDIDPRAIAVFMQSHVIGQIVNDMSAKPMGQEAWDDLIIYIFSVTFFGGGE